MSFGDGFLLVLSIIVFAYLGVALFKAQWSDGVALALIVFVLALAVCWRYLGAHMVRVYDGRARPTSSTARGAPGP